MTDDARRPTRLPRPLTARLHRLSLYAKASTIEVEFPSGVFCLAGANGLGKSTFLTALNFAITGTVPEPSREFRGVDDYYSKVRPYSTTFFRGRVEDEDTEAAEVGVELLAGPNRYRLCRGMFEPLELRELDVVDAESGDVRIANDAALDPSERHRLYSDQIVTDCGLDSFAQLVFLQHFVLTFDERRDLLFWGERTLPAALFIAFGLDPRMARRADTLQETARKADSLVRNYNWQASDWRRQLENLENATGEAEEADTEVVERHRELNEEQAELRTEVERISGELANAQLRIAEHSSQLSADRERFDGLWAERLQGHGNPATHPLITTTLQDHRCALCGTQSDEVLTPIETALEEQRCPLCESSLSAENGEGSIELAEQMRELDTAIESHQQAIAAAGRSAEALTTQQSQAREKLDRIATELNEFERNNELALLGSADFDVVAERYRAAIGEQLGRKEEQVQRRNSAKAELRELQRELVRSYGVARERFVPNFTRLAEAFLGLSLDIDLESRSNRVGLQLSVQEERRRAEDQLSESQRFFLDIALRMALVAEMSSPEQPGAMYVDTPEGSLDIAYEARAGDMLGTYACDGHTLIMTANINTSKLLERLALKCGKPLMRLERMTDWTYLSDVQADEEELFNEAYRDIERALEGAE
jgi:energy-coupling factor transporter ATP-binding protein EcfA2